MRQITIKAPDALNIQESIFSDSRRTIFTANDEAFITYEPETRMGIIYNLQKDRWSFMCPVEFEDFLNGCLAAGYTLPNTTHAARWLAANSRLTAVADGPRH